MGQPLYCSAADAGMCGERGYSDGSIPCVWLSSTASLPWLRGFPPPAFPTMISSLTYPQSVCPQSTAVLVLGLLYNPLIPAPSRCPFQETSVPAQGAYGCGKDCLILIPFRLPQISLFTLSLKFFSSDSGNCLDVGVRPLLQFPNPPRVSPGLLTLLFFPLVPSSYWVLRGSIYSFPLVRSSCLLSAGVLPARLCLKVYSWWIHGERCIPCPHIPPPSCFLLPTSSYYPNLPAPDNHFSTLLLWVQLLLFCRLHI